MQLKISFKKCPNVIPQIMLQQCHYYLENVQNHRDNLIVKKCWKMIANSLISSSKGDTFSLFCRRY